MNRSALIVVIAAAAVSGFIVRGWIHPASPQESEVSAQEASLEHEEEPPHVPLSQEAFDTLGLRLGSVQAGEYQQTTRVPAEVVEFPGLSAYKLAAPLDGVVSEISAHQGASVSPGEKLFEIRLTDELVLNAQLRLVESLTRLEIVQAELDRLQPLTETGVVRGRQRLDLEYELRQLETSVSIRRDELLVRGLTEDQIDYLIESKRLLRNVTVSVPTRVSEAFKGANKRSQSASVWPITWEHDEVDLDFSIEKLSVEPGQNVERGESLCDLASHTQLYLRGHAFESDLPFLLDIAGRNATLSAEFGHSMIDHGPTSELVQNLSLRYVANHLDPDSKSYSFYLPLKNELLHESIDEAGRRYRTWKYSVGQGAHVLLPTKQINDGLPLPLEAVAIEGPNAYVFVPIEEHDESEESIDSDHEEVFIELGPVPVTLLYRDNRTAVVASDGQLRQGDRIVKNGAYQLLLALKAEAQGGGHGHHHDH